MAKTTYEVTAVVGRYTDQHGKEKNRYQRIGSVIETSNGPMIKLDTIPLKEGGWDGWAYMNDPKPRDDEAARQQQEHFRRKANGYEDDEMPF
mgnify:FL=1